MTSFADARLAEIPPALNGREGQALAIGLGQGQDDEVALLRVAALSRLAAYCPDDALDGVGAWLNIERFAAEPHGTTTSGYRGRLCAAWSTWSEAGSAQAIIDSLRAYGIVDVAVYQDFEGSFAIGQWYSRFWVLLGPTLPWSPMLLGSWVLGAGTLGSSARLAEVKAVKRQILKWKSAHSYPVRIVLDFGAVAASGLAPTLAGSCGGAEVDNAVYWHIGKLFGLDTSMPFTMGGYEV